MIGSIDETPPREPEDRPTEAEPETSILRLLWYPLLVFIVTPTVVMLAVKFLFGV